MGARGVEHAVEAMQAAFAPDIEPPPGVDFTEDEMQVWRELIPVRARAEWTPSDLRHLANLVRCHVHLERLWVELRDEEDVTFSDKGVRQVNPKHVLATTLEGRAVRLTRLLHMQAQSTVTDVAKLRTQRAEEQKARAVRAGLDGPQPGGGLDDDDGDDLLARPPGGVYQ